MLLGAAATIKQHRPFMVFERGRLGEAAAFLGARSYALLSYNPATELLCEVGAGRPGALWPAQYVAAAQEHMAALLPE